MDRIKVRPSDWIVLAGALVVLIGSIAPWYGVKIEFAGVTVTGDSVNGWHGSYLGWFVALLCLAAAAFAVVRRLELVKLALPVSDGAAVLVAGALSALIVLVRVIVKPDFTSLRWGIFVTLLGTLAVAAGGFLMNAEPAQHRFAGNDDRS